MKKSILLFLVVFCFIAVAGFCEPIKVVKPVSFMDEWSAIIGQLALMLISIVGPAICVMLFLVIKKIAKKLGFEIDEKEEAYIKSKLKIGMGASEMWAKSLKEKPTSHEKMLKALEVSDRAMDKTKAKKFTQDKMIWLVESMLDEDKKKQSLIAPTQ